MSRNVILFDLDDTLLDDKKAKEQYLPHIYQKYAYLGPVSFQDFKKNWYQGVKKYISLFEEQKISFFEQEKQRLEMAFQFRNASIELIQQFYFDVTEEYEKNFELFENAIPVIKELQKSNPLGIVTNGNSNQQIKKIKKFDLDHYFDIVIISQDVGLSKPNRKIFEIAKNGFPKKYTQYYFVGDNFKTDIEGSYNAGMIPIWFLPDSQENISKKSYYYIINDLGHLLKIVN